ncbi:zinc-binding dehydrogenase [Natronobiforma cellulositropha]|uniref:zinc-binding dehydrogenase n=1 Tax=Natronobiforma cellulositropha TaxID=1679076 RepID=UPI0021D5AF9C|nr:zinc-binding dehydrogenase [Natronobiforma cellulositropha]
MRCVVATEYGDPSVLSLTERPPADLAPDAVRVDVAGAGVNFADIEKRRGRYHGGPEPPFVPGMEVSGTVLEVGEAVDSHSPGDEVACILPDDGGYAETVVARAPFVFDAPPGVGLVEAGGTLIQCLTAHNVLHEWGGVAPDHTVVVTAAAGGVGSIAVQLASAAGATVVAAASTQEKLEFASAHGAAHLVNYEETTLSSALETITDGAGADLLLDGVGGRVFSDGLRALAPGGVAVSFGVSSGDVPTVATPRLLYANTSVVGYHLIRALESIPERVLAAREPLYDLLESGDLTVTVAETHDLADAPAVHAGIEARETRGRTVLVP